MHHTGKDPGHQIVITARDGDRLEIYNPFGYSGWVTESQFIHSQMDTGSFAGPDNYNDVRGAELPK
ncbi:hypothetical protein ABZW30_34830 [Kitasatospora sp. NPDC004669]|uniref:hypothetical protein n=1 Tax=Kitasatospora sp. NPDC004669 TaxID=3154555 RepID=UPI0033A2168B